ncbi:MAG TPA: DUF4333 domain-containing protein [Solirubrobacterales bacterium]|jgi:hypothetical protein
MAERAGCPSRLNFFGGELPAAVDGSPKKYEPPGGAPGPLGILQLVTREKGRRMSFLGRLGLIAALIAVLAFVVGCGDTVIDATKTEEALQANLSKSLEEKVSSVECPSDQKVEAGTTFTCNVELPKGKEETATLKILNTDADVSVIKLSGSNE